MEGRRVVISGVGAITPLGNTAEAFFARLVAGETGVRRATRFDPARYADFNRLHGL